MLGGPRREVVEPIGLVLYKKTGARVNFFLLFKKRGVIPGGGLPRLWALKIGR